jgi:hypothetical protein
MLIGIVLFISLACVIGGGPSLKSPSSSSPASIPLYSKINNINLGESDLSEFLADNLGRDSVLYASSSDVSWSEDTGDVVREYLDSSLPDKKWRLQTDWYPYNDQELSSIWGNGDLQLYIIVWDNLNSEIINNLKRLYGISGPTPGSTLILTHVIDTTQPLPDTTATKFAENQNATSTAEYAAYYATATADTANYYTTATQDAILQETQTAQIARATSTAFVEQQASLVQLSEDFNSDNLSSSWTIYRPDPSRWDLTSNPGFLHIVGTKQREAGILNIFGEPVTYSDVEVVIRIEASHMTDGSQSVFLAFSPNDYSDMNYTVEIGIDFDYYNGYQVYMQSCQNSSYYCDQLGNENIDYTGSIYLRLVRTGKTYVGYYGYQENTWTFLGQINDVVLNTNQIIIGAVGDQEFDAYFDYIHYSVPK